MLEVAGGGMGEERAWPTISLRISKPIDTQFLRANVGVRTASHVVAPRVDVTCWLKGNFSWEDG